MFFKFEIKMRLGTNQMFNKYAVKIFLFKKKPELILNEFKNVK